ncbi:hypothetical protein NP233_g3876 [Leucocoprinus birnbaumii]|uniref:S-Me-THD-like C-terminal domain-containing protein n=1 Tax=Leucocoprinus birnbaumii TaxID=56174 RepID=A0AAD5YW27_9AGAR|nr:hypothetical protein NP233_g3876 [Leucocoprinus birnbaumii]
MLSISALSARSASRSSVSLFPSARPAGELFKSVLLPVLHQYQRNHRTKFPIKTLQRLNQSHPPLPFTPNGPGVATPSPHQECRWQTIMRVITTEMGSAVALCPAPLSVSDARDYGITRCLRLAWWIGKAICVCRQKKGVMLYYLIVVERGLTVVGNMTLRVAEKILECQNGKYLFVGKIIEVSRGVKAGFTWGYVRDSPLLDDDKEDISEKANSDTTKLGQYEPGTTLRIPFQNGIFVVASAPDLITVLDSQTGSHLGTPEYHCMDQTLRAGYECTLLKLSYDYPREVGPTKVTFTKANHNITSEVLQVAAAFNKDHVVIDDLNTL